MRHEIAHAPAFATVEFHCQAGESLIAQPGCMLAMTPGFEVTTAFGSQMRGGSKAGRAVRSMLSGESLITAIYTAKRDGESITLAPSDAGELRAMPVSDAEPIMLATGAFIACTPEVQLELKYVGVRGLLATRGLFLMRTTGRGEVFVASHGALVERKLAEGERFVVDNRFIIAFSETVKCELVKVATSMKHSFLSGEGLVNRYTGPGWLLYQTRAQRGRGMMRGILDLVS